MTIQFEMTPGRPADDADSSEELILTPSLPDEPQENFDLLLEAGNTLETEEITFDGEEEAEKRIAEAMSEYDKAMDEAAGIKQKLHDQ